MQTFFANAILQIRLKNIFSLKKLNNSVLWTYVINDLNNEEILGAFFEKNGKCKSKRV